MDNYPINDERIHQHDVRLLALEAEQSEEKRQLIIQSIYNQNPIIARNSAWVMTHFSDKLITTFQPRINEFIDLIMTTDNISLKRLILNIVDRLTLSENNLRTDFIDFCLEHMMSLEEPPGVQTLCMKLAHKQCLFFPELQDEFYNLLNMMEIGNYATCVKSLHKKMVKTKQTTF